MYTSNVAIIPKTETIDLATTPIAQPIIEPKEGMIVTLEKQNQDLLQVIDKTTDAYEKIIEEKDQTNVELRNLNDKLVLALTDSDSRFNKFVLMHEATLRSLQEKDEQSVEILNEQIKNILLQLGNIESFINNTPFLQDYKTLKHYLDDEGQDFRADYYGGLNTGIYPLHYVSTVMSIVKGKMDDRYKDRPNESLNILSAEAAAQADLIKNRLQNIKDVLEKK